jgi:hypothetical protein
MARRQLSPAIWIWAVILAFGRGELVLGDGVRWEIFRQADNDPRINTASVAVDQEGRIYARIAGGFGRVEIDQVAGPLTLRNLSWWFC